MYICILKFNISALYSFYSMYLNNFQMVFKYPLKCNYNKNFYYKVNIGESHLRAIPYRHKV